MKLTLKIIAVCITSVILYSCKLKTIIDDKYFNEYVISVMNDTSMYELNSLQIIDKNIYPILDSVIIATENCEYFDARMKRFYGFRISSVMKDNGQLRYSIYAHQSIEKAIGLHVNKVIDINKPTDIGVFYYKNYLFLVSTNNYLIEKEIKFSFYKKSNCFYRIYAPNLYKEKIYSSYLDFKIEQKVYTVSDNKVCGEEILIR